MQRSATISSLLFQEGVIQVKISGELVRMDCFDKSKAYHCWDVACSFYLGQSCLALHLALKNLFGSVASDLSSRSEEPYRESTDS